MKKYMVIRDNAIYVAGTTLKVKNQKEGFNMALHACVNENDVIENRQQFADDFNIDLNQCVFAKQTHSDHLVKVSKDDMGKGAKTYATAIEDTDALYTKDKGICLGVFHADCVPVLVADPISGLVCAIHSGWLGTVKEITAKSIAYLKENEGIDPKNLKVYIGASISQNNFEVGSDVVDLIKQMSFDTTPFYYYNETTNKYFVDNKALNKQQCINEGVLEKNITVDCNCTFANQENFFSYRKDKNCGRHMSFIMLKGE